MDTVYFVALFEALSNLGEVLKIRGDLKRELSGKSWEEINKEISP